MMPEGSTPRHTAVWVYVRAGNMDNTMLDTQDLAIVRGSSLSWLRAPEILLERMRTAIRETPALDRAITTVDPVMVAASEGVFRLDLRSEGGGDSADSLEALKASLLAEKKKSSTSKARAKDLQKEIDALRPRLEALKADPLGGRTLVADPAQIRAMLVDLLRPVLQQEQVWKGEKFPLDLFTFFIAVETGPAGWSVELMNRLRRGVIQQQLTSPDFIAPPAPATPPERAQDVVCAFDRRSAALPDRTLKGLPVSSSALRRHTIGRRQKERFYTVELEALRDDPATKDDDRALADRVLRALKATGRNGKSSRFAQSFSELLPSPRLRGCLPAVVQGKLCLITLDGNNFGKQVAALCGTGAADSLSQISGWLLRQRRVLLAALLDAVMQFRESFDRVSDDGDEDDSNTVGGRIIPFETLLWGGDEMQVVCPAWMGFSLMARLQETLTEDRWTYRADGRTTVFAHSAGMVFAGIKTPIQSLRSAAGDLCDQAKTRDAVGPATGKPLYPAANLLQIEAIEGGDFADLSVEGRRGRLLRPRRIDGAADAPALCRMTDFTLPGSVPAYLDPSQPTFGKLIGQWKEIKASIGKSGLHDMLRAALKPENPAEIHRLYDRRQTLLAEDPALGKDGATRLTAAAFGPRPGNGQGQTPAALARLTLLTGLFDYFDADDIALTLISQTAQQEAAE